MNTLIISNEIVETIYLKRGCFSTDTALLMFVLWGVFEHEINKRRGDYSEKDGTQ